MNMQDNELDELFRTRLDGLEIQPSEHIWANISAGLGEVKKRSLAPVLSMAATVLVLLTAGIWFWLDEPEPVVSQNTVAQQQSSNRSYKNEAGMPATRTLNAAPVAVQPAAPTVGQPVNSMARLRPAGTVSPVKTLKAVNPVNDADAVPAVTGPAPAETAPVLAAVTARPVLHPVVPEMQLSSTAADDEPVAVKAVSPAATAPVMAAQPEKRKRHGIHSLGDLVNVVVAKVDKREDKLIEFTESDGDQSNITGINLGLIKVKRDK